MWHAWVADMLALIFMIQVTVQGCSRTMSIMYGMVMDVDSF